jgi:hypothetical protein
MAMSALEVAAIFRIDEQPALRSLRLIAEQVKALGAEIKEMVGQSNTAFGSIFTKMDTGIGTSIIEVGRLKAAWREVEVAALAAGRAGNAGPRSGFGPRTSGFGHRSIHASPMRLPTPGGHVSVGSGAFGPLGLGEVGGGVALAGGAAAAYGVMEAFEMGDTVSRGLANVFPGGDLGDRAAKEKELTDIIVREAKVTGLPLSTVSKMALDEIGTNANQPWDARMRIMPMVIENAAREAYIKGSSPESTTSALIGQLHQTGAFTQEEIEKNLPMLAYFASKDPNSIVNIGKSSAYHSPLSRTMMGIPIEQDLAAQTVLDRTGVGGKSGTWLREMVTRAAQPKQGKHFAENLLKLEELGLSAGGHPTWMTDGHYDESKLLHILSEKLKGVSLEEREAKLRGVFGERGSGAVAQMTDPAMLKQYDEVLGGARSLQPTPEFWKEQNAANPMQQLKGTWTDLQAVLLDIGKFALPMVTSELKVFDGALKAVAGVFNILPGWLQSAVQHSMLNAGTGGMYGAGKGVGDFYNWLTTPKPGTGTDQSLKPEKQSYIPPPQKTDVQRNVTTISLDGTTLARFVDERIARDHEHPDSASAANGVAYNNNNDWNTRSYS